MPTALSAAPTSSPSSPSRLATAFRMPRSMFVPWSPSPIAVSRRTSSARCSSTSAANRRIHARTSSRLTVAGPFVVKSCAPSQRRCVDRRVPQSHEVVVEPEQRDRAACHLQRGDVVADQAPLDRYPALLQEAVQLAIDDEQLDQRRAAHTVDEREYSIARLIRQV